MRPLSSIAVIPLLVACGGGGGSSSNGTPGNTFAVRANVSNVRGAGLALRNNGVDTLDVPAAPGGPVTFATRLASGARYAVRVARQPTQPSQTCTVTSGGGGTGVIASADVAVDVSCVTDGFTVGGSVSNLTSPGLVLGLAGQADVNVDPGTTQFTFPSPVESGSPYGVRVVNQPAPQQCVVLGGAGTVGGAEVTSVQVVCDPVALTKVDVPGGLETVTGGSVTFAADLTPANATDRALTWKVCAARANDAASCTPAPATTHGTITDGGVYTAPPAVPASPYTVNVLACQGAICGASSVAVHAGAVIDSFTVTPQTINWDNHAGMVTMSWSVRDASYVALSWPAQPAGVDVTGRTTYQVPWSTGGDFTLTARSPASLLDATKTMTIWVSPVNATPTPATAQGYLSPDGRTLICDFDIAYDNTGGERASFSGFRLSTDNGQTFGAVTPLAWTLEPFTATRWLWTYFGAPGQSFTQVTEEHYTVPSNQTTFTLRRTITCNP